MALTPMAPQTKAAVAFEQIRNAIQSGELPPGERITLTDLSQRLGMSLTPVREALRQLASQGLVTYTPHHGSVVAEHGWKAAEELYDLRLLLEPHAVRRAADRLEVADLSALGAIQAEADRSISAGEVHLLPDINRRFHERLYVVSGSPHLEAFIRTLWQGIPFQTMSLTARAEQSSAEHHGILRFLHARDADAAAAAMHQHIAAAAARAHEVLSRERLA